MTTSYFIIVIIFLSCYSEHYPVKQLTVVVVVVGSCQASTSQYVTWIEYFPIIWKGSFDLLESLERAWPCTVHNIFCCLVSVEGNCQISIPDNFIAYGRVWSDWRLLPSPVSLLLHFVLLLLLSHGVFFFFSL